MGTDNLQKTQALVSLAQAGDQSALNQLFAAYGERVRRIIRFRLTPKLRSKLDSIDVVQEALFSAIEGIEGFSYQNEGDFLRWLAKIAENKLRDQQDRLYAGKRDIRREVRLPTGGQTTGGDRARPAGPIEEVTPSALFVKREEFDELEKAVDALDPELREAVLLVKLEGLTYRQASERLGKSPDAVRRLLNRAMTTLTRTFECQ